MFSTGLHRRSTLICSTIACLIDLRRLLPYRAVTGLLLLQRVCCLVQLCIVLCWCRHLRRSMCNAAQSTRLAWWRSRQGLHIPIESA